MCKILRVIGSSLITACLLLSFLSTPAAGDGKSDKPLFRVEVDTVYVWAAVTDPLNRYVTGLEQELFNVYEDGVRQTITSFSEESAPVSIGFVLDISGSMAFNRNVRLSKYWLINLLKTRNPGDEFFLITFNDRVHLIESFTQESGDLQDDIALVKPGGQTALFDAVYRALDKVKEGRNDRKALIVISDGEENSSRYKWREMRECFRESGIPVYGVGYSGPMGGGNYVLQDMANITGGRVFGGVWSESINLIFTELRTQYLIGYVPANTSRNGKWRKLAVKLDAPRGFPNLKIRTRPGYYAAKR